MEIEWSEICVLIGRAEVCLDQSAALKVYSIASESWDQPAALHGVDRVKTGTELSSDWLNGSE